MSSLNTALNIAKTALLSTEKAISVASHNIANANTEGYTRQKVALEDAGTTVFGGLEFGNGVNVASVERVYDSFLTSQLRSSSSLLSRYSTSERVMRPLETLFNDLSGMGLSKELDAFFNAFSALANSPSSYAERSTLLSTASVLAGAFNSIDGSIRQNLDGINKELLLSIEKVNSISDEIAELNNRISIAEASGVSANDLRDRRDVLLEDLSSYIDITTYENASGIVDVYVANGSYLVAGVETSHLSVSLDGGDPAGYNIISNGSVINSRMSGGSLKGLLDGKGFFRDALEDINLLSASVTKEVNLLHSSGYGLDGSTGLDFFDPLSVTVRAKTGNTGGASVTATAVTDLSLVTLDDYEIRFSGPGAYTVVNARSGSVVSTGAYSSGSAITFDGISVTLTDNSGPPAGGDVFRVSATDGSAMNMAVSITDTDRIAASSTLAGIPGDNANALALSELRNSSSINGASFGEYYRSIVTDIGLKKNEVSSSLKAEEKIVEEFRNGRDSVSGVSLEEESINLIKLQRAYEAAAKVLTTVDEMMETLLNIR